MSMTDIIARSTLFARSNRNRPSRGSLLGLWRSRRALAQLDQTALDDIGVSAEEAHREATRPIWDVPAIWKD
ncbi:DUF1127 domain-containing protein [Pseudosulfitobacter sp. DSM 107133]|jgi:uncharacterized protein YjiS (DUF1127 family)|uniref:DUF1127 domain-containing protein n=1 Tax=Pseudosulfitobacter sp. DSM 107133 TaxID=2883100 RepID=UPI000DF2496D|nr:DUF1127 domain-containing protein [Pseudosulfitobacter sp. DSM 107133]UOA26337.1 hypothetical protein DSM107133_01037 [Pseudosulfitobacter sp. DSM 107133]